jgi:hypothetical protein
MQGSPAFRPQNIVSSAYSRLSAESDSVVLSDHRTSPLTHFLAHLKALVLGTEGANSPRPQAGNRTFLVETHLCGDLDGDDEHRKDHGR